MKEISKLTQAEACDYQVAATFTLIPYTLRAQASISTLESYPNKLRDILIWAE